MEPIRLPTGILALFVALLAAGLATVNLRLMFLSLVPAAILLASWKGRVDMDVKVRVPDDKIHVGEMFQVTVDYRIRGGPALVQMKLDLADELELVKGNNLLVFPVLFGRRGRFRVALRGHRRARYDFGGIEWTAYPIHRLAAPTVGRVDPSTRIDVRPHILNFKRTPGGKVLARDFRPAMSRAKIGATTTDFRDLRPYQHGDSLRTINWKATAKTTAASRRGDVPPIVNEFEFEGTHGAWIFFDQGRSMKLGTNLDNCFERGIEAARGLARLYLDQGMQVGLSVYDGPEGSPIHQIHPAHGSRQALRITQDLHALEVTDNDGTFHAAVKKALPYIRGGRTFVIVVTRMEALRDDDLDALRALRNVTAHRRGRPNLVLVSPDMYDALTVDGPLREAVAASERMARSDRVAAVKKLGIRVIRWEPSKRPLHAHLLRGRR